MTKNNIVGLVAVRLNSKRLEKKAFLSLYYQASSTWKSTLGLPCVPQQFRRAVSLFKRLHEFHNGKIQLMKRRTSRLDAAASNLNEKFDNVCRKIKTAQDSLVGIGATVSATGAAIDECDSSMGDLAIKAKYITRGILNKIDNARIFLFPARPTKFVTKLY